MANEEYPSCTNLSPREFLWKCDRDNIEPPFANPIPLWYREFTPHASDSRLEVSRVILVDWATNPDPTGMHASRKKLGDSRAGFRESRPTTCDLQKSAP